MDIYGHVVRTGSIKLDSAKHCRTSKWFQLIVLGLAWTWFVERWWNRHKNLFSRHDRSRKIKKNMQMQWQKCLAIKLQLTHFYKWHFIMKIDAYFLIQTVSINSNHIPINSFDRGADNHFRQSKKPTKTLLLSHSSWLSTPTLTENIIQHR